MNVEGAAVEQRLGRTIMPRFHAGWSLGTIAGAGVGVLVTALDVPCSLHLAVGRRGRAGAPADGRRPGRSSPAEPEPEDAEPPGRSAWLEPRTLAIGLMVLAFAAAEGSANDWLTLALIDGHDVEHWVGVARLRRLRDRDDGRPDGRAAAAGPVRPGAGALGDDRRRRRRRAARRARRDTGRSSALGIVVWGLGASLGFPVGMSAAADDPARAAARVSVVSTLGYSAFLAGPPLLGQLADRVGHPRGPARDRGPDGPRGPHRLRRPPASSDSPRRNCCRSDGSTTHSSWTIGPGGGSSTPLPAGDPEHVALLAVRVAGQDEQQVGEPVEVLDRQHVHGLAVLARTPPRPTARPGVRRCARRGGGRRRGCRR